MDPDLKSYNVILVNSSGGKDSQAMLDYIAEQTAHDGIRDRVVVVHADLGRVEWEGTRALAEQQARHYGFRFEVVARSQDLLDHVAQRGKWPDSRNRYCTSDHKRGQVGKVITKLATEHATLYPVRIYGPVRILNCLGMRAEESPARAKLLTFERNERASSGRRTVDTWLPIHDWTVGQVWDRIRESGVPHHFAYDLGMPRLSCCFCIFAPKAALMLAGKHNPKLLDEYVQVERNINHRFRVDLSLADVKDAIDRGEEADTVKTWRM